MVYGGSLMQTLNVPNGRAADNTRGRARQPDLHHPDSTSQPPARTQPHPLCYLSSVPCRRNMIICVLPVTGG